MRALLLLVVSFGCASDSSHPRDRPDSAVAIATTDSALEEARSIVCRHAAASLTIDIGATVTHTFTPAECGGVLPDASYVGMIAAFDSCTSRLNGVRVLNTGDTSGPGMVLRKADENTASCTGSVELTAVYIKR